jgi:outer membrane lipoprotein-sorting protein
MANDQSPRRVRSSLSGILIWLLLGLAAGGFTASAQAAEFSASIVTRSGTMESRGKIFVKGNHIRRETSRGADTMIIIGLLDKKLVRIIRPGSKVYLEMPLTDDLVRELKQTAQEQTQMKLVGTETVNGYATDKYETTFKSNGATQTHFMWIAKKLGMPIKIVSTAGSFIMEYRDIKEGGVADSLFEAPPGYQKMGGPAVRPMK